MSSIWDFIKRHRGKIVATSVAVGGIYTAKKIYDSDLLDNYLSSTSSKISEQESQLLLARKHFIFDSHQQSCDKTLIDTISDIKMLIKNRYPIEILINTVKEPNILPEDKIKIFQDIKLRSISRIISTAFSYSLIIIASKTQKSIVCAETCKNIQKQRQLQNNDGVLTYVSSLIFGEDDSKKRQPYTDPKVQQVFLNCIQFLTTTGLNQLFNKVDLIVEELLVDYQLNKVCNTKTFAELFDQIINKIEVTYGNNNFADLIVPITNVNTKFNNQDSTHLEGLLTQFVSLLRLNTCKQLMQVFVRRFINRTNTYLKDDIKDNDLPLAKFLPAISDAFNCISKNTPDSPFQDCLHSHELHQFTLMAFDAEQSSRKLVDEFGLD